MKERKKIKFRTSEYDSKLEGTTFNPYEDELKYDKEKDCLVKVGTIDTKAKINSFGDCALDKVLDKYLDLSKPLKQVSIPKEWNQDPDKILERVDYDLADLGSMMANVDKLKVKYGLNPTLSYNEVVSLLNNKSVELKKSIEEQILVKKKEINDKEVIGNEEKKTE